MDYVKVIAMIKRKPGLSFEEFQQYYEEHHALLAQNVPEIAYYVRRYLRPLREHRADAAPSNDYDVITELWYASIEDFQRANERMGEGELALAIKEDEERLFDRASMRWFFVDEHHSEFRGVQPNQQRGGAEPKA